GIKIKQSIRASHPDTVQKLVRKKYGIALVREGAVRDPELMTRPMTGLEWTVDTAFIYSREHHPNTIPTFLRLVKRRLGAEPRDRQLLDLVKSTLNSGPPAHSLKASSKRPIQLSLFAELGNSAMPGIPQAAA
ncbi:MAG TPA: LysR substrate-binding domain-containing protein, partial [Terriglobia bacterium]|nr:LysR substrate-binding domain-containing protein [Terriglobia bacterium]